MDTSGESSETVTRAPVADLHRNNNLSEELYEVKKYWSYGENVGTYDILTDVPLDLDAVKLRNSKVDYIDLVSSPESDTGFYKYQVTFVRSFRSTRVRMMFPGCFVFPKPTRVHERTLVRYDQWNNVYVPI